MLAQGYAGPLKLQVVGPWTLAATVELHYGDKAVSDPGATRDLTQSLAEGVRRHVADMADRLPDAQIVLQLDEPALPAVLVGDVPTASGFGTLRRSRSRSSAAASPRCWRRRPMRGRCRRVVHCCAPHPPVTLFREAGAGAVSFDMALLSAAEDEPLGTAVEAGVGLWLGVVPAGSADDPSTLGDLGDTVRSVRRPVEPARLRGRAAARRGRADAGLRAGRDHARRTPGRRSAASARRPARSSTTRKADRRVGECGAEIVGCGGYGAGVSEIGEDLPAVPPATGRGPRRRRPGSRPRSWRARSTTRNTATTCSTSRPSPTPTTTR